MQRELVCDEPATPPRLLVRTCETPRAHAGQVRVRVNAAAVNPIDVKRASGYGRRLLGLKGAASFPLVLGNDFAGQVEAIGAGVSRFVPGQHVFGVAATGKKGGSHASHVIVPQEQLRIPHDAADLAMLATLPYSFTTMWLDVRRGALASRREWRAMRAAVTSRAPSARYEWTLFRPDREALDVLEAGTRERKFSLPIGIRVSLEEASAAFAHVAAAKPGRALLAP
jgi:NADPH:quinone reductase-like Zn-dependent oxidoreductase